MPAKPSWQPVDMAAWASLNKLQPWVVNKLAASTLPGHLFRYLKKKNRDAHGGKLPEVQRKELTDYLRGEDTAPAQAAGKAALPAPTKSLRAELARVEQELAALKSANARTPRAQRGRSGGRGREGQQQQQRPAAAGQQAGQGSARAEGLKSDSEKRLAAENAELKRKLAEARQPAADIPMAEELAGSTATGWNCALCGAAHTHLKKKTCRLCDHPRVAAKVPAAVSAARSPEEIAAERLSLQRQKDFMAGATGLSAEKRAACIKEIEATMLRLDEPPTAAAAKTPTDSFNEAREARDQAEAYMAALIERGNGIVARREALQLDLDAVERAITIADQEIQRTLAAYTVAHSLVGLPGPQRPVATEFSTAAALHIAFNTVLVETLRKYIAYRAELADGATPMEEAVFMAQEMQGMKETLAAENIRMTSPAAPPPSSAPTMQPSYPAPTPAQTPAPVATTTRTAHQAASCDGSRLAQRPATKAATIEATKAHATLAAADHAQRLRKEARAGKLEARREGDGTDAETAGDTST